LCVLFPCTACPHHLVNAKLGSPAFKTLRKIGEENFVPGFSPKNDDQLSENLIQETIFLATTLLIYMMLHNEGCMRFLRDSSSTYCTCTVYEHAYAIVAAYKKLSEKVDINRFELTILLHIAS